MHRLAVCISAFEYGGQGTVVEQELLQLRNSFDVTLMTDIVSRPIPDGIRVVITGQGTAMPYPSRSLAGLMRQMDVVHCHDSLEYMWAAHHSGIPWIVTCHGICPLRFRTSKRSQIEGGVTRIAYPWLYRKATAVVAISSYIRQWLQRSARVEALLILNGLPEVDDAIFSKPSERSLLYVGEVSRRKGIDLLLRGLTTLPDDVTLTVVGKGDIDHFRGEATDLQLSHRVHFTREVSEPALRDSYRRTFAVASASRWEGFGLPILEGFGHGRPALVKPVGGMKELVELSDAGATFSTPEAMRPAFDRVDAGWDAMSRSAIRYAAGHEWSHVFGLYADLLSNRARTTVCQ
jgi:glycosyltransferase involved in cell wall biosynthesis